MSAGAKVLIVQDLLQPYQSRFLGMDVARAPDRTSRVRGHIAQGCGFSSNILIIDEIGYDDSTWAAIKPTITEGVR